MMDENTRRIMTDALVMLREYDEMAHEMLDIAKRAERVRYRLAALLGDPDQAPGIEGLGHLEDAEVPE